jgi:hypothetical protein
MLVDVTGPMDDDGDGDDNEFGGDDWRLSTLEDAGKSVPEPKMYPELPLPSMKYTLPSTLGGRKLPYC